MNGRVGYVHGSWDGFNFYVQTQREWKKRTYIIYIHSCCWYIPHTTYMSVTAVVFVYTAQAAVLNPVVKY